MADFLLEVSSEEMPHSAQKAVREFAPTWLQRTLAKQHIDLSPTHIQVLTTPRRLIVILSDLPVTQQSYVEEKKGPPVDAPPAVLRAFLAAHGLSSVDECTIGVSRKRPVYIAHKLHPGEPVRAVLAGIVPVFLRAIPWPKSMRWLPGSSIVWPRPMRGIMAVFNGELLPVSYGSFTATNLATGHRFMGKNAPVCFSVSSVEQYKQQLYESCVRLEGRRAYIREQMVKLASREGLTLAEDPDLLDEVADLTEWPVPYVGRIDEQFMTLPDELLKLTMRAHQKYFALYDAQAKLAPRFICVVDTQAEDEAQVLLGFERVLRARLSDAAFLWEEDKRVSLGAHGQKLSDISFHKRVGSVQDKIERMAELAASVAPDLGELVSAVRLCKVDLATHTVCEFPELQGVVVGNLARHAGVNEDLVCALVDHCKPVGPSDSVPRTRLGQALAVVDKLDTLVQFFAIGEEPTSSKDPFALRRMALGIIRICDEGVLSFDMSALVGPSLRSFFIDRLVVYLDERYGVKKSVSQACVDGEFNISHIVARAREFDHFLNGSVGRELWQIYKRVSNVLEQNSHDFVDGEVDAAIFETPEEKILGRLVSEQRLIGTENLQLLCSPTECFFATTLVNDARHAIRQNRLRLINRLKTLLESVFPFHKLGKKSVEKFISTCNNP